MKRWRRAWHEGERFAHRHLGTELLVLKVAALRFRPINGRL
jgi:hypothetical protein